MQEFKCKKSLGQNFLKDDVILRKIVSTIDLQSNDLVIEIGPGKGALTTKLQEYNVNLLCYEVDNTLKKYLDDISNEKTTIKFQDFLKANVSEDISTYDYDNLYIIANLPYYITTPIIKKITQEKIPVNKMVLMVQKEVAQRFAASYNTSSYGSISVYLSYFFEIRKLFDVPKQAFSPMPKVDSSILQFVKINRDDNVDVDNFSKLLTIAFAHKRKNLKNNFAKYDLQKIQSILQQHGYSLQNRAEQLPLEVYISLALNISFI